MQCNIDAKGKLFRLVSGLIIAVLGVIAIGLYLMGLIPGGTSVWVLGIGFGLLIVGAFGIFEGWAGWCAMRAMGFKTRI